MSANLPNQRRQFAGTTPVLVLGIVVLVILALAAGFFYALGLSWGKSDDKQPAAREARQEDGQKQPQGVPKQQSADPAEAEELEKQSKMAKTVADWQRIVEWSERIHGSEHRETIHFRIDLSKAYMSEGRFAEGEVERMATVKASERIRSKEFTEILNDRYLISFLGRYRSRLAEAEPEARAVLELREKNLGSEHPDTLEALYLLSEIIALRDKEQALQLANRAADGAKKVLGPKHRRYVEYKKSVSCTFHPAHRGGSTA